MPDIFIYALGYSTRRTS